MYTIKADFSKFNGDFSKSSNSNQHFKCVLLDLNSNLGRVRLKVAPKIFVLFYVDMKQNNQQITVQENA